MAADLVLLVTRGLVLALFTLASVVAASHWGVRRGHLSPFGAVARVARRLGQPLLRPIERRLYRGGGNPASAPYALFWVSLAGGLAALALVDWLVGLLGSLSYSAEQGPRGLARLLVHATSSVLMAALFIRVLASWFGLSRYSRPMRLVYGITDWLVEPIRRVLPPFGMIDASPMVAYLLLLLARGLLLGLL